MIHPHRQDVRNSVRQVLEVLEVLEGESVIPTLLWRISSPAKWRRSSA